MNQPGAWDFVKNDTLEVPALLLTEKSNFCSTQKQEPRQTAPYQDKWLMTGGVITLMSCKPFPEARMSFLVSNLYVSETIVEPRFEFFPCVVFLCFAAFL